MRLVQFVKVDVKKKPGSNQEPDLDKLAKYILEELKNEASKDETKPKLLMSVLGGAWDFPVSSHVKETFHKGIVNAAVSSSKFSSSI